MGTEFPFQAGINVIAESLVEILAYRARRARLDTVEDV